MTAAPPQSDAPACEYHPSLPANVLRKWAKDAVAEMVRLQEELVRQFCLEIAGTREKKGSVTGVVRLQEMAQALYKAEAKASPKGT